MRLLDCLMRWKSVRRAWVLPPPKGVCNSVTAGPSPPLMRLTMSRTICARLSVK